MLAAHAEEGSLAPVRDVIPESCYVRSASRSLAFAARDLVGYLVVLTALAWVNVWWLTLPLIALAGLVVSAMFIIGHDASHGAFSENQKLNGTVARILMLPSMHVQEAWVLGHNRIHHGFTARQDMDFVWRPYTAEQYQALSHFGRLRHRLEWSPLGSGAYYLREVWWNKMITFRPPERWAKGIKRDRWLVIGWAIFATILALTIGFLKSGTALGMFVMWIKLVVAPFLLFNQVIGWAVYVHHVGPEVRWWTRQEWTRWRAQMESTTILRLPWIANLVFHNIFIHVPHHVEMRIPWYQLPQAAVAIEAAFPGTVVDEKMSLKKYLHSTRTCKLYDFEQGVWSSYKDGSRISTSQVAEVSE